ncbi:DEAH-box ATP-dependent RNA helicase prp43 [Coelomomyces lativittatus]|nr:DEAH-box ATP-dependent RNA helicase prp43 [Coelomomyces lativittatus]
MNDPQRKRKAQVDHETRPNPYLAHRHPTSPSSSSLSTSAPSSTMKKKNPFSTLTPDHTTAAQAMEIEDGEINPFTLRPFSKEYRALLKKRRDLPVSLQRDKFLQLLHTHQILVFVGETGSGKTTQLGGCAV